MKQIMVVKPNTISKDDKAKLTKAGIIVVEHPYPPYVVKSSITSESNYVLL